MDTENRAVDHAEMAKQPRRAPPRPAVKLYIGEWMRALGQKPAELARAKGINEGYVSQLISGSKTNPSPPVLSEISDFLGIPLGHLYGPPPPADVLRKLSGISPQVLARLRKQ